MTTKETYRKALLLNWLKTDKNMEEFIEESSMESIYIWLHGYLSCGEALLDLITASVNDKISNSTI